MSTTEDIHAFLTKRENLSIALEIADHVDNLKNTSHRNFWSNFNHLLAAKLKQSQLVNEWTYEPFKGVKNEWGKSYLAPKKKGDVYKSYLVMVFAQANKPNYRLFWGIHWRNEPPGFTHPDLLILMEILHKHNIKFVERSWIGSGYNDYSVYSEDFLYRINNDPDGLYEEIIDKYWGLFVEVRPLLERINQAANT